MTSLPDDVLLERHAAFELHGSMSAASSALGISRHAVARALKSPRLEELLKEKSALEFPDFPDDDIPVEQELKQAAERFEKRYAAVKAHEWFTIKVNDPLPIGILWFGDPHIDDNGCNLPRLLRDVELCRDTEGLYGANIGDTTNNWSGRLVKLYANQDASLRTARRRAKWFMLDSGVEWLVWLMGNHDCLSSDTALLTKRGWIDYRDIQKSDQVVGISQSTGLAEWQSIEGVIVKPADRIWKLQGARHDIACTERHRVLVRKMHSDTMEFRHPPDLPKHFRIPVARSSGNDDVALSDDEICFAAWVLTDGHIDPRGNVSIYQSKPGNIAHITRLLDRLGFEHSTYKRKRAISQVCGRKVVSQHPQFQFLCRASARAETSAIIASKDGFPDWLWSASDRQFLVFLMEYIRGDGSQYPPGRHGAIIYGTEAVLDGLQALCVVHGVSANISQDVRGAWRLNVCFKEDSQTHADGAQWEIEPYEGDVWCLKVPHGNFLVRRNGKPHFTGNCWNDGAEALKLIGANIVPMHDWEARFILEWPDGSQVRVNTAHDFPGHSQWNENHGPMKEARLGADADLFVCGHKHNWHISSWENANRRLYPTVVRARGYKTIDEHTRHLGIREQETGASILTLIRPNADDPTGRVQAFADVEFGAQVLTQARDLARQQHETALAQRS